MNKNLCPYFEWWQFPLTDETLAACSQLPDWEPEVNPLDEFARKYSLGNLPIKVSQEQAMY